MSSIKTVNNFTDEDVSTRKQICVPLYINKKGRYKLAFFNTTLLNFFL
jgi:hypothetical protein